jgi:anti-anti-sigma factor
MQTRTEKDVLIISIENEVAQEDTDVLQKKLLEFLEAGTLKIVLDMSQCGYINSMGLSTILHIKIKFNEKGGDIKIARINTLIKNLFELTNLNKIIDIFETVEEGVSAFQG